jgi:hypothetical protein
MTKSLSSKSSNAKADSEAYNIGQNIGDTASKIHPIAAAAVAAGRMLDYALDGKG